MLSLANGLVCLVDRALLLLLMEELVYVVLCEGEGNAEEETTAESFVSSYQWNNDRERRNSADDVDTIIGEVGSRRKVRMVGKLRSAPTSRCREYLLRTVILRCELPSQALPTAALHGPKLLFVYYAAHNLSRICNTASGRAQRCLKGHKADCMRLLRV